MSNEIEYTAPSPREAATIRWHLQHHIKVCNERDDSRLLASKEKEKAAKEVSAEQDKAIFM